MKICRQPRTDSETRRRGESKERNLEKFVQISAVVLALAAPLSAWQMPKPNVRKKAVSLSDEERRILEIREILENMDLLQNFEMIRYFDYFAEKEPEKKRDKSQAKPETKQDERKEK